jgi:hypothetical protein
LSLPRLDLTNTLTGLEGSHIAPPSVDTELIDTYVKYFVKSGLLSPGNGNGNRTYEPVSGEREL